MSHVILTKQGLEQSSVAENYLKTFSGSDDDIQSKVLHMISWVNECIKRNEKFIQQQQNILNLFGGMEGLKNIRMGINTSEDLSLEDLLKMSNKEKELQKRRKNIQDKLNSSLQKEKEFQDYIIESLNQLEILGNKKIPSNKFNDLIRTLRNNWKESIKISDDDLLKILEEAQEEIAMNEELLEKKYQYLRTILDKKRSNPLQIKQKDGKFEVSGLDKKTQIIQQDIQSMMQDLIIHFQNISNDKGAIIKKLSRWRTTTRKQLSQNYANMLKKIEEIPEDSTMTKRDKQKLRQDIADAIATYITHDPTRKEYEITASLRGNLAEITRSVTVKPIKPIDEQIADKSSAIVQFMAENIGHSNKRKVNIMMPLTFTEEEEKYYYKINNIGKLTKIYDKNDLSEGEFLLTDINERLSEVDGKTDRLYGYNITMSDNTVKKYYIAYSDKFKEYSSLANLPVVGNINKKTNMAQPQPLNSNMGLFSHDDFSKGLLFAILNKSTASYLNPFLPSINELEKFVASSFLDMSFDPSGLQKAMNDLNPQLELNDENTLYIHELGGGFILPVFQVLEAMKAQSSAMNNYGLIIKNVVSSALSYGPAPNEEALMAMLQMAQPSDRWEWVASYIASTIKIQVELHLEQLFQIFGIIPVN